METPSTDTTSNEAVFLHVSVDNVPEIQSFREAVETSVMDKSFDNVHVAGIHHEMADLSYLNVSIDGIANPVKGLHDSGAQISVIHPDLIKDILPHLPREGTVKLKGLIGDPIDADLIFLSIKLSDSNDNGTSIVMAMSDKVNNGLILTDLVVLGGTDQTITPVW